jgi:predicted ATPase
MQDEISFGKWLHKQRRALDFTLQAFADQVGCAEVTLRRIEAGTLKPSKELAIILLENLGVPKTDWSQWISFARGGSSLPDPPTPSSNKPISNLPEPITTFIGREKEQTEVIRLLTKHRLVTLTGPGGVGKTRLAIKAVTHELGLFPDGIWFLDLASVSDPAFVPNTLASLLRLRESRDTNLTDLLINYFHSRTALVIFDNCEHLIESCAQLVNLLLTSCEGLYILATSREALLISGEIPYRVPSLEIPTLDIESSTSALAKIEAVRLFTERAEAVSLGFSIGPQNATIIAQICRHLDGIPLAIELAATWVRTLPCDQIAQEIEQSLGFLTTSLRKVPERHHSMQAVFDHSWRLLSDDEKNVFRKLSVFRGGFKKESAANIAGLSLPILTALMDKSLVRRTGEERYDIQELLRQYAYEKMMESGEAEQVQKRHLEFFLRLAKEIEPKLRGAENTVWLNLLDEEHANLRSALQWSLQQEDAEAGFRLAGHLWWFWFLRGYWSEGRKWLTTRIGTQAIALQTQTLSGAGWLALYQGDYEWVTMFSEEILTQYGAMGDKASVATLLDNLGMAAQVKGDDERAKILFDDALVLRRVIADQAPIAQSLLNLGGILVLQGNYGQAKSLLEESLAIYRELDDQWNMTYSCLLLGFVALFEAQGVRALPLFRDSLSKFQKFGDKLGIIYSLLGIAVEAASQGKASRAANLFGAAEILTEMTGFQLSPGQSAIYENSVAAIRDHLGETAFTAAWSRGRAWSLDQAITYAIADEINHYSK